jgi:mutual gliding-motility protein MglA
MPTIDSKKRRIDAKIIFVGPGRSGKTSNVRYLAEHLDDEHIGKFVSLPTKADSSIHIDVLPVWVEGLLGFRNVFHLCTAPGLASAMHTRQLLLRDSDGIVFVADSHPQRRDANIVAFQELEEMLTATGVHLTSVPHVVQYNKCDLDPRTPVEVMRRDVNPHGVPEFLASASTGQGVNATLRAIIKSVSRDLKQRL